MEQFFFYHCSILFSHSHFILLYEFVQSKLLLTLDGLIPYRANQPTVQVSRSASVAGEGLGDLDIEGK